jgi:hypothetical protein
MVQVSKPLGFIEKHGLWSDEQRRQAEEIERRCERDNLQLVRLAWADPHGASRAKAVTVPAFLAALSNGYNINVATTTLDSANARTFASFTRGGGMGLDEMTGSPNLTIVPDPATTTLLAAKLADDEAAPTGPQAKHTDVSAGDAIGATVAEQVNAHGDVHR